MFETYCKIPRKVLNNHKLCSNAKLLYGDLILLCHNNGYCYATNKFLAHNLKVSARTISRLLKILKEEKLIKIKYDSSGVRNIYMLDKNVYPYRH